MAPESEHHQLDAEQDTLALGAYLAAQIAQRYAGGACVFLEGDRCRVYAGRPRQCRDFPRRWRVEGPCPGRSPPV